MTTQRLFPATNGPALVATSGGWMLGTLFSVTGGMRWFEGYYVWVPTGGDTTPRKCALWQRFSTSAQNLVSGSVVTSGTLSATPTGGESGGHWNLVSLATPIQLAPGALYVACSGWTATNGIPVGSNQFGSGDPLAAGIVSGFLTGWSAPSGSNPFPAGTVNYNLGQQLFSNALGADPSVAMPNNGSGDDFLGMDVLVSDTAPGGYSGSYRLYPNMADLGNFSLDTANGFTLGKQFTLSGPCTINNAWFYSPATVTQLPTAVGVYRTSDQTLVAVNNSPSWSGAAGSGWISAPFTGTVPAGTYKYVVFQGSNVIWNAAVANYYTTGFGGGGLTAGPISVPNNAGALSPGQESYHQAAAITYPDTNAGPFAYGLDLELTPSAGTPHTATASLTVTPTFSAGRSRGKFRTGALTVAPVFSTARALGHFRTGHLAVTPGFSAGRSQGHTRHAALLVSPSLLAVPSGGRAPVVPMGSWWGLDNVFKQSQQEFAAFISRPPVACPNDGEPLRNPPNTRAGSGMTLYCRFCGWQYPRDYIRPVRL